MRGRGEKQKEDEDRNMISPLIFRRYDIRGIYNRDISAEVFLKIGLGLGALGHDRGWKRVVVGCDIRNTSGALANALTAGMLASGLDVTDIGVSTFGICAFAGWKLKKDIVAFITASHLPPEWNGLKLYYGEGIAFSDDDMRTLRDTVLSASSDGSSHWEEVGDHHEISMKEEYVEHLASLFDIHYDGKVILDCGNGCMGTVALDVMQKAGVEHVDVLFPNPDCRFPNRPAEPTAENLSALRDSVLRENADFGAAFDGDGDRVVFVDDRGRVLSAEQAGVVVAREILRSVGETDAKDAVVLANVECSMLIDAEIGRLAVVRRIPVGHTFLTREASRFKAVLGIESSGHFVIPEIFPFDDAMLMPLKMADVLADTDKKLSEIIDELPKFHKHRENIKCPDEIKFEVMRTLEERLTAEFGNVELTDGIRIVIGNGSEQQGWVLIRASNTEPLIRITCEARSKEDMLKQIKEFKKRTEDVINVLMSGI